MNYINAHLSNQSMKNEFKIELKELYINYFHCISSSNNSKFIIERCERNKSMKKIEWIVLNEYEYILNMNESYVMKKNRLIKYRKKNLDWSNWKMSWDISCIINDMTWRIIEEKVIDDSMIMKIIKLIFKIKDIYDWISFFPKFYLKWIKNQKLFHSTLINDDILVNSRHLNSIIFQSIFIKLKIMIIKISKKLNKLILWSCIEDEV